ncbi:PREDICTED: uncharacterized protein LOC107185923 [Dufourea novaeangliae]|uniref:uncharacterized protein LOC107185923 n=1 Tax=Dufourea novaeangliae TaxID=178035 RepID=UPI0007679BA4|nr:PREDICTED: uncharacterized protein LOC107185923 [Dufourea novaeangliae]
MRCIDSETNLQDTVNLSKVDFPIRGILNNNVTNEQESHTVSNQTAEGSYVSEVANREQNIVLMEEAKHYVCSPSSISCMSVRKTSTITSETALPKDTFEIGMNIREKNKDYNKTIRSFNDKAMEQGINFESFSLSQNITTDIENSSNKVIPNNEFTQISVSETFDSVSRNLNLITMEKKIDTLHNNDSPDHTEECSLLRQESIIEGKSNEISNGTCNMQRHLHANTSLQTQKRSYTDENVSRVGVKKVKLNRHNWCTHSKSQKETISKDQDSNKIIQLNSVRSESYSVDTSNNEASISVEEHNNTVSIQVTKMILNKEQGISKSVEQASTETIGHIHRIEYDTVQKTGKSEEVVTESCKSPPENTCLLSVQTNSNNENINYDEDDCISLFADSILMEEYNEPAAPVQQKLTSKSLPVEKPYFMSDNVFDNYYKNISSEFNKAYDTNNISNSTINVLKENEKTLWGSSFKTPQTHKTANVVKQKNNELFTNIFKGYCFHYVRFASCSKQDCRFNHNLLPNLERLLRINENYFFEVIDQLLLNMCHQTLRQLYNAFVCTNHITTTLKLLKKLYDGDIINRTNDAQYRNSIGQLIKRGIPIETIVYCLDKIVNDNDTKFVSWISGIISKYIAFGKYWSTMKTLIVRVGNVESEIINIILNECVTIGDHVHDINENILSKLNYETHKLINQNLLSRFNNLLKRPDQNTVVKETAATVSDEYIKSPDPSNGINESEILSTTYKSPNTISPKVWKNVICDNNNNTQNRTSSSVLHPIDDLPKPHSIHGRERFWKFYLDVHSLQEGLKHNDHDHVKAILDSANEKQKSVFTRAFYQILRNEVEHFPYHLSKLVSTAVRTGATAIFYEILIDVTIHVLVDLVERELWVLALKLLKEIDIMLHESNSFYKFDAATILLFAEIYLANQKPMKAFALLKQSKTIYTTRNKWKVRNNEKDGHIRAQIISLLLDAFCETSPEYAFFLFKFLIVDQSSNYYPVDLTCHVNKIVSLVLLKEDHDLIVSVGELINKNNLLLNAITYRALIASLVSINLTLAKELHQNAIGLGIYSTVQFCPATYIIVKSDWTNEEMYLTILDLLQQLSTNIGHTINGIKSKQLSVYLLFESTPSERQLNRNEGMNQRCDNKIRESTILMKNMLKKQFDPPLWMVKNRKGKLQKLNGTSLRRYLQSNQNFI